MKSHRTHILTGIFCFVLGMATWIGIQGFLPKTAAHPMSDEASLLPKMPKLKLPLSHKPSDDVAADPFEQMHQQMQRMQRQMMQEFESPAMLSFSNNGIGDISQREDDKYVYIEVPMHGSKQDKLKVRVSNGEVQISGVTQTESQGDSSQSFMSSSFHRSFPIPPGVDEAKVQMENTKDKLIIKFPKLT